MNSADKAAQLYPRHSRLLLVFVAVAAWLVPSTVPAATNPVDWDLAVSTSPLYPTSEDAIRVLLKGNSLADCTALVFADPQVEEFRIRLQGRRSAQSSPCAPKRWEHELVLPQLMKSGYYWLEVMDEEHLIFSQKTYVSIGRRWLVFPEGITARLLLTDPRAGEPREVPIVQLTKDSGYFWFFAPDNIEVTLKLLDGRPINGHYWIFLSGMTDLGLTVTVTTVYGCTPSGQCPTKTYVNQPGKRLNVIDTNVF